MPDVLAPSSYLSTQEAERGGWPQFEANLGSRVSSRKALVTK